MAQPRTYVVFTAYWPENHPKIPRGMQGPGVPCYVGVYREQAPDPRAVLVRSKNQEFAALALAHPELRIDIEWKGLSHEKASAIVADRVKRLGCRCTSTGPLLNIAGSPGPDISDAEKKRVEKWRETMRRGYGWRTKS